MKKTNEQICCFKDVLITLKWCTVSNGLKYEKIVTFSIRDR